MADERTLAFYSAEAPVYADAEVTDDAIVQLNAFADMVPAGGDILDFGCGSGWAAAWFQDRGFQVRGFDGSDGLVEEARKRFGLTVDVGQFSEFRATNSYDGIWASFCLLHDRRDAMPDHLSRIRDALRRGSAFYLGLKTGSGERRDRLGRLYTYFGVDEITGLLTTAGFRVTEISTFRATGYEGRLDDCMHILATRD